MKKLSFLILTVVLLLSGCSTADSYMINTGGSTSVEEYFTDMTTDYMAEYPNVHVSYDSQGSTAGIEGVINGTYQIGTSSREIQPEEMKGGMISDVLALDGIALIVNPENSIDNLTLDQISKIYTGDITNWKELGGCDCDISVVSREDGSGTRDAFESLVGFDSLTNSAITYGSNGEVATAISNNKNAIGYVSFSTLNEQGNAVKGISVENIVPTAENVQKKLYPISRPFIMVYIPSNLDEQGQELVDWVNIHKNEYLEDNGLIQAV